MLKTLMRAREALPDLLNTDLSTWKSMHITYEYPHVQRLWKPFGKDARIYLHIIESIPKEARSKGAKPFLHPHPWPSAVMLLNGSYRMATRVPMTLDDLQWMVLTEGSSYEMTAPNDRHLVDPIDFEVMSMMVTGPLFNPPPRTAPVPKQPELPADMAERLYAGFKSLLTLRPGVGYHPEVLND